MNDERMVRPTADRGLVALMWILMVAWAICRGLWPESSADAEAAPPAIATSFDTAAAPTEHMVGTVKAVDPRAGTLLLVTGVGHALRVVRVTIPPGLAVRSAAQSPPALEPGCIVQVECGHAAGTRLASASRVASSVTVLRLPLRGRTP
jgi:hypothetical protein